MIDNRDPALDIEALRDAGVAGGRSVFLMNKAVMRDAGLAKRQLVDITSHFAGEQRTGISATPTAKLAIITLAPLEAA